MTHEKLNALIAETTRRGTEAADCRAEAAEELDDEGPDNEELVEMRKADEFYADVAVALRLLKTIQK